MALVDLDEGSCTTVPHAPPAHPDAAVEAEQLEMACYNTGYEVECILPDGAVPSPRGQDDQGGPAADSDAGPLGSLLDGMLLVSP